MIVIPITIKTPPHNGAVTHIHLQWIILHNLRVRNMKNIKPNKPTPPDEELSFDIMLKFFNY